MGRTLQTKKAILRILSARPKTLTDISHELALAPSTISQHLVELRWIGAIEQVENAHIRKWKYYKLAPNFNFGPKRELVTHPVTAMAPAKVAMVGMSKAA